MITYKHGDIFEGDEDIIIHGCNCKNNMGAGIAVQVKQKYPGAYMVDQKTTWGDFGKLGLYTYFDAEDGKTIINAYTQYNYTAFQVDVDYDAVKSVMTLINENYPNKTISMPKIGAGLAGGDWNIIEGIINEVFGDREVFVYIWNPGK